ncbi:MAG: DUF3601 domain-containing protein [Anaerolineales bacterium]
MRSVLDLQPGITYTVLREICDYYDNIFQVGEKLTFTERHYLPYDGGHTLVFGERRMYLQKDMHAEILDTLGDFLAPETE